MDTAQPPSCGDSRHLIQVRDSPGKGLGIFAKTNIPRGTRILAESSLIKFDKDEQPTAKTIMQAFESLSPSQQESYLELDDYVCDLDKQILESQTGQTWDELPEMHRRVLGIYTANSFGSIHQLASRFNHSCLPNTTHVYNPTLDKETFHTIQDVSAGEELLISYMDGSNWVRSKRQEYLQKWGFECNCPACEDNPEGRAKEEKRLVISLLSGDLEDLLNLDTEEPLEESLKLTQRLAAMQKSAGLVGRELCYSYVIRSPADSSSTDVSSYYYAAKICTRLGDARMALLWAEKGLEVNRYCVGEDHPEYKTTLEAFTQLKTSWSQVSAFDDLVANYLKTLGPVSKALV